MAEILENLPLRFRKPDVTKPLQVANQMRNYDKVLAYWCEYFAASKMLGEIAGADDVSRRYVASFMDHLEQTKKALGDLDNVHSSDIASTYVEAMGQRILNRADNDMFQNQSSKLTAEALMTASTIFSILAVWDTKFNENVKKKIAYCKWHAARILKALVAGKDPNESNPRLPSPEFASISPELSQVELNEELPTSAPGFSDTGLSNKDDFVHEELALGHSWQPETTEHDLSSARQREEYNSPQYEPPHASVEGHPSSDRQSFQTQEYRPSSNELSRTERENSDDEELAPSPLSHNSSVIPTNPPFPVVPGEEPATGGVFPPAQFISDQSARSNLGFMPQHMPYSATRPITPPLPPKPQSSVSKTRSPVNHSFKNPASPAGAVAPKVNTSSSARFSSAPILVSENEYSGASSTSTSRVPESDFEVDINKAQKHAKWAISALNFEDVPTAIKELRNALATLEDFP